jgi:hypothetical protein
VHSKRRSVTAGGNYVSSFMSCYEEPVVISFCFCDWLIERMRGRRQNSRKERNSKVLIVLRR